MSCDFCKKILTEKELSIYRDKSKGRKEGKNITDEELSQHYILACEKHWCRCMPETTPWRWINKCNKCSNMICKSCWCMGADNQYICRDCFCE